MRQYKISKRQLRHYGFLSIVFFSLLSIAGIVGIEGITNNVSALDYQSENNIQFTFNPTITVNLSGDLIIDNLAPGSYADSNIVTVTTSTNVPYGFTLMATAGTNSTSNSLVNSSDNSHTFTALDTNKSTLAAFNDNTWGYSYSTDNGTTWVSGNTGSTTTGYNGLPKDTNTTAAERGNGGITLATTDTNTTSQIQFKIGAKASSTQPAGTYTNTINFYAVGNPKPVPTFQDYDLATCATEAADQNVTLQDARDGNEYTVKYINGQCWMTQNLRYLGDTGSAAKTMTIGNNNSNVANQSITLYSLNSSNAGNFNPYSGHCDSSNGYNYACVFDSGDTDTGVWYNFYAASGGTISGSSNSTAASNDICPSGWHLPSGPNTTSDTDFNKLVGNTTSGWQNPTAGFTAFGAVAGGHYNNGSLSDTGYGYWWSATEKNATDRYGLMYNSSNGQFTARSFGPRYLNNSVRCVMKTPTMQNTSVSDLSEGEEKVLPDERDGNDYTVKKINGELWMTQNLRFQGTSLDSATSNVTSNKTLTYYDLAGTEGSSSSGHCYGSGSSGNGYSYACKHDSGNNETGVWYNYAAASAMTVTGTSNSTAATEDICPKGWHLPSGPNTRADTDFNKLVGNTTGGWQNPTAGLTAFGAVAGGVYVSGSLYGTGFGYWWSATASNATSRYHLSYNSSSGQFLGGDYSVRHSGYFVRCVRSS